MFINCESSERKAKINDCQDSLYLSYYNFLKNGNKISGSRKAETSFNFTLDCIWFILSEFGKLDQFIFIILWQGVLMARVIDVKITTASLARLGARRSRERAGGCSCYFNQTEARRKDEGGWVHWCCRNFWLGDRRATRQLFKLPSVSMLHSDHSSIQILPYKYILRISVLINYVNSEREGKKRKIVRGLSF